MPPDDARSDDARFMVDIGSISSLHNVSPNYDVLLTPRWPPTVVIEGKVETRYEFSIQESAYS